MPARRSGSVRHLGGDRYQLRWSTPNPTGGQPLRRARNVHARGTRQAEAMLREQLRDVPAVTDLTVAEVCERWLEHTARNKSERTADEQARIIRLHIAPTLGKIQARRLTETQVNELYLLLAKRGKSSQTVRHVHNVLSAAFRLAVKWRWLPHNPVEAVAPPSVHRIALRPPLGDELAAILRAVERDPEFALFVRLGLVTGARRAEIGALQWGDIDLERGAITIRRAMSYLHGRIIVKDPKTHQARRIGIDAGTVLALQRHWDRQEAATIEHHPEGFVFCRCLAGCHPSTPGRWTQAWARACREAGVKGVRLHDVRHAVASLMFANGVDVLAVSARLGHAKPSTTLNVYGHLIDRGDGHAEMLAALLPGAVSPLTVTEE